ncbi:MAG: MATE family efflux transporter [Ruminococcus sp.]
MNSDFMKTRPIFPLLLSMSLPMVISMLVNSLYNIIDSFFVAKISEDAMTSLSLVFPVQNFISATAIGFGIGINAVIAIYLGAGRKEKADIAATQGLALSALHGIVLMIICILIMPAFLSMFTSNKNVVDLGVQYCNIVFTFSPALMLAIAFEKIFQSVGRMKISMFSMLCGCIANIILDPLLIFGVGFFPEMGIKGAALATGIGQVLTLVIYIIAYLRCELPVKLSAKHKRPDGIIIAKMYSIGIPATLNLALPSLLISALNGILAAYSQSYVLVLGIYYKLQTFLYLPANGVIQGMRPVISFNYGAGEKERVKKIYRIVLYMTGVILAAGTIICALFPAKLIGLFTENADTIAIGKTALRLICIGFVISAVSVTSSGALEGAWHGHSVAYDISVQIYCDNTATCVLPLQAHGTNRRMERILDNRSRHRFDICIYLQIFSFKAKRFKINTATILSLPLISV